MSKTKINQLNKRITSLKAFKKPAEIKAGAEIIPDSLYLYGVDWMSNKDIKNYIGTQFPNFVIQWINDSSCTIKMDTNELADQLYMQFSVRPAALMQKKPDAAENAEEPKEGEEAAAKAVIDDRNFDNKLGWREALGYEHEYKGW